MNRNHRPPALAATMLLTLLGGMFVTTSAPAQTRAALVQDTDAPGRNPYQWSVTSNCQGASFCTFVFPAISAGLRLVATHTSGSMVVIGTTAPFCELYSPTGTAQAAYAQFTGAASAPAGTSINYSFNPDVLAYFEAGETPTIRCFLASGTFFLATRFSLTGYSVKSP